MYGFEEWQKAFHHVSVLAQDEEDIVITGDAHCKVASTATSELPSVLMPLFTVERTATKLVGQWFVESSRTVPH